MATPITQEQREDLITLLVGMFDAAPSANLLTDFVASIQGGQLLPSLANDLTTTSEFASLYSPSLTDEAFATQFATNILGGYTTEDTLNQGIEYVIELLEGGVTGGEARRGYAYCHCGS